MARCPHGRVSIHRSSIVDGPTGRRMRAWCNDCQSFVETIPIINKRSGNATAGEWVRVDYTIHEPEFDAKT